MAGLKFAIVLAVVATGTFIVADNSNITEGRRIFFPRPDQLLWEDEPKIDSKFLKVQSNDECYPKNGSHWSNITFISVTDIGKGGSAFITNGGAGRNFVCLHLKTQRGKGYHFHVQIYGYPF